MQLSCYLFSYHKLYSCEVMLGMSKNKISTNDLSRTHICNCQYALQIVCGDVTAMNVLVLCDVIKAKISSAIKAMTTIRRLVLM
jgi:hypothetical protein